MRRTQVQLGEATYNLLRQKAFEKGVSMAALLREALREYLLGKPKSGAQLEGLSFVGSGLSAQKAHTPVSERHDEALVKSLGQ